VLTKLLFAIEALEVTKIYKNSQHPAVKDVSLAVDSGKIFTLLGRNGAGKTTFVRMCATQLKPTYGTIRIFGHDTVKDKTNARQLISMVPQEGKPLRALTAWDHVYNWLIIRDGLAKQDAKIKAEDMLEKLGLYKVKDVPTMQLSGGMKQKTLVAQAMAVEAQLLFLDEPTIGLDPVSRRQVWSAIKDWKRQGKSVFLTTHYMDEAEMLSDDIAIINKGRIVTQGTMKELRRVIPQNVRIDIAFSDDQRAAVDPRSLESFGSVVDTGAGYLRVFAYESSVQELSEFASKKSLSFTISPVTLDDVFVFLVGEEEEEEGIVHDAE
jgi:ABC-2 type transport system ATP-binding protein